MRQALFSVAAAATLVVSAYANVSIAAENTAHAKQSISKNGAKPTVAEAEAFLKQAEAQLEKLSITAQRAAWVYETHITDDTEAISAQANELALTASGEIALKARRYNHLPLSAENKRKLKLLQLNLSLSDAKDREAFTKLASAMSGAYGKAKYCAKPNDPTSCKDCI